VDWNEAACVVFGDFRQMITRERNAVWRLFTSPTHRQLLVDWERDARRVLAQFRASCARYPGDPRLTELIHDLMIRKCLSDPANLPGRAMENKRRDSYEYDNGCDTSPSGSTRGEAATSQPRGTEGAALPQSADGTRPTLVGSVMLEAGYTSPPSRAEDSALDVNPLDAPLLDAFVRLVRLLTFL